MCVHVCVGVKVQHEYNSMPSLAQFSEVVKHLM